MHLYFWLGEIQKIIRKSPRDIRAILERSSLSPSSRAYQMLEEGSSPTHVAITLGIREEEVNEYYRDYWSFNGYRDICPHTFVSPSYHYVLYHGKTSVLHDLESGH